MICLRLSSHVFSLVLDAFKLIIQELLSERYNFCVPRRAYYWQSRHVYAFALRPEGKDVFAFMAQRLRFLLFPAFFFRNFDPWYREIGQGRSDERLGEIGEKILPKALNDVKKYKNSPFSVVSISLSPPFL